MENIETLLAAVAQTQGFDDDPVESTAPKVGVEISESRAGNNNGVQLAGEISGNVQPSAVAAASPTAPIPEISVAGQVIGAGEKRKRGRPPKGQLAGKPPPPKRNKVEDEEEDVCFICFDGGSLVLCDRKGCPKAYHPACIKRDEAFFKSKAKWNCGWHICSVCRKTSHYTCYTCTYSLCKGCTRGTDYVCVRGNKGFCTTCMKTIMLIEDKDRAKNESVQVDFDDKTSWEYLFKVYWVCLKEKLSLTLSELLQAKPPWKPVPAVAYKPQLSIAFPSGVDGKVPFSSRRTVNLELNAPCLEASLPQNDGLRTTPSSIDNHVEKLNCNDKEVGLNLNNETLKPNVDKVASELGIKEITDKPDTEKDQDKASSAKDTNNPCVCENTNNKESDKPRIDSNAEWASKDLLEFVAHVRNGDTSSMTQFDVQNLLLDYIKRNNLRDPHQKSHIVCDLRLKTLFEKPRVGHIEMLKLLEFHFPVTEDSQNFSLIPAGFVASDSEVDGNTYSLPTTTNSRKRKTRKKNEDCVPQNNLSEYAAIDAHNINLIYLRRNLMENLLLDQEDFTNKVIGSIVRIRTSSNDQKQDVYRLVRVVGTSKVAEPYKIGERTANAMLEVLNLDKKEVVSIDAISNQEFTEDECRRLRQSIRCGVVKQFTVGEVQKIAMALQPVRINDWLEAEILRLSHLRDRANENGRKKELRECVEKLEQLKSPGERQRRISEIPEIHADLKMDPDYESEEDSRNNSKRGEYVRSTRFHRNGRNPISPDKKGKEEQPTHLHDRMIEKTGASGSHGSDKHTNGVSFTNSSVDDGRNDVATQRSGFETSTTTASVGNSPAASNIETEKLWHYRDPNGKIQGPFSMIQLRKWSTTGLFPPDMRIWTNHEQYDSLLLMDALIGHLHGATTESSQKPLSESLDNRVNGGNGASEGTNGTIEHTKPMEVTIGKNVSVLPDNKSAVVKENVCDTSWPHCWDLLNGNNSSADDVQEGNVLPQSSCGQTDVMPPVCGQESDEFIGESQNGGKNSSGLTRTQITSGDELQMQSNNDDQAMEHNEDNPRSLNIDLSSNAMESEPVIAPCSNASDLNKQDGSIDLPNLDSPSTKTAENQTPVASFLELLSPTPRSNSEDQGVHATETKQSGILNFPLPDSGPNWNGVSSVPLSDVAEWNGYNSTAVKPSVQEWESGLASTDEYIATSTSDGHENAHASTSQPASDMPSWLEILNAPIEFDALGEESVSDLLAEVDAMESQGALCSPTSAIKFAREFLEECRDDCFSSIEDFNPTPDPQKCDASGSTGEMQWTSQSSCRPIEIFDAFDSYRKSSVNSSASSEGETNAQVYSGDAGSEFHPPAPTNTSHDMVGHAVGATAGGSDPVDPGWGNVQGNINLVTVQGNVNLVLGGPGQGMGNLGWGNPGATWVNPTINHSPRNGSLPWDGQRKYGSERFASPRASYQGNEPGFVRGRPPRGRQAYNGGGGYSRQIPKGQRVCKFYESGHCKKGAFCNYLHP